MTSTVAHNRPAQGPKTLPSSKALNDLTCSPSRGECEYYQVCPTRRRISSKPTFHRLHPPTQGNSSKLPRHSPRRPLRNSQQCYIPHRPFQKRRTDGTRHSTLSPTARHRSTTRKTLQIVAFPRTAQSTALTISKNHLEPKKTCTNQSAKQSRRRQLRPPLPPSPAHNFPESIPVLQPSKGHIFTTPTL